MNLSIIGIAIGLLANPLILAADMTEPIKLWPKGAPGEKDDIGKEHELPTQPGPSVIRITDVTVPTITIYHPPHDKDTGATVIVCPGGGYGILAWDLEGTEVVQWLNSIGVTGVLLKYRVPSRKGLEKHTASLQDAQRAMGLVRFHAKEWRIDPKRIGIMGFSAGGHLSAALSNNHDRRTYEPIDEADNASCRPDFAILVYPAYLTLKDQGDRIAAELKVTENTPPTILIQTEDDGVRVENSLFYYLALKNAKVPVEMHLYPKGGHGYGLRPSGNTVSTWPQRVGQWLHDLH